MNTKPIRVKLIKYILDIKNKGDKAAYEAIKKECKALGHKLFDYAWMQRWDYFTNLPDEQTIETEMLFDNQYNTVEGFRIFDWTELIDFNNRNFKNGYYLTGDIEALKEAKRNQYICGYCGARYEKQSAPTFCTKCISSEYLKEKDLPLLQLKPVSGIAKDITPEELEALHLAWQEEQPKLLARMKDTKRLWMIKKAADVVEKAEREAKTIKEKAARESQLLLLGIDTENLIYYPHTDQWVFGWRHELSLSEADALHAQLSQHREELGAQWCDSIEFKTKVQP